MTSQVPDSELRVQLAAAEQRATGAERRLEQVLDELESVTSMVNHDLRSPLVSVMGFAAELRLLTDEALQRCPRDARLAAEIDEAFAYLDAGAKRMARLLDTFSALGALRRRVPSRERVDTRELLELVAAPFRARVKTGELVLGALPVITSDRAALSELFTHLLDNAVRYLRPEVPARIELRAEQGQDTLALLVIDNGRGLAASDFRRVFRPFVQVMPLDPATEGLGLAFAQAIARRLGGNIGVESELGRGSTFRVELPAS